MEVTDTETKLREILLNLNMALDAYWNGNKGDSQIKLITYWQRLSQKILEDNPM